MQSTVGKLGTVVALASLIVAAGVQESRAGQRDLLGLLVGGGLGALVGSQFGKGTGKGIATAGGAVLGGVLGNALIGPGLFGSEAGYAPKPRHGYRPPANYSYGDASSYRPAYLPGYRPAYVPAYRTGYAPAHRTVHAAAPAIGHPSAGYCREYESTVFINGRPQPSHGLACYRPDGTWRIVR